MANDARFEQARLAAEEARQKFEDHDPHTFQHGARVSRWATLLANHIPGLSPVRQRRLGISALLHDYDGPLPVADEFLESEGIRWHRKHYDGSGVPEDPRQGMDLPLESRLIAVANTFDELTSEHPYRGSDIPYSPSDALELMEEMAGSELDPSLVSLFATVYGMECERVGGEAGSRTLQVLSVIGREVERARELLQVEIGPFDPKDPLGGRQADDKLTGKLTRGLLTANLDPRSSENVARYVLRLPLEETFRSEDLDGPPRKATTPPGGFSHHMEVILTLHRIPEKAGYLRIVVFMGQLWLCVGEHRGDTYQVRLAR